MLKNTIVALSLLALLASPSLALSQSTSSSSVSSDTQLLLDKLDSLKKELIALLQAQIDDLLEQIRELQAAAGITSSSTSSGSSSSTGTTGSTSGSTTSSGGATTNTTNTSSSNTQTTTYTSASDTTVPSVSLSAPSAGATVSGTATISATASDNVIVSRVDFSVDGVIKNSDYSSPYSFSWDTTSAGAHACLGAHTHSISARAYDAAGNWANTSITVNMNNPSYCASSGATNTSTQNTSSMNTVVDKKVKALFGLKIRSAPSSSGTSLGTATMGATGKTRCGQVTSTCPAVVDGNTWWYIDWDDSALPTGWSVQGTSEVDFLEFSALPPPPVPKSLSLDTVPYSVTYNIPMPSSLSDNKATHLPILMQGGDGTEVITFSTSGLPYGTEAFFSPATCTGACVVDMALTAGNNALICLYDGHCDLTVSATVDGVKKLSSTIKVQVRPGGTNDGFFTPHQIISGPITKPVQIYLLEKLGTAEIVPYAIGLTTDKKPNPHPDCNKPDADPLGWQCAIGSNTVTITTPSGGVLSRVSAGFAYPFDAELKSYGRSGKVTGEWHAPLNSIKAATNNSGPDSKNGDVLKITNKNGSDSVVLNFPPIPGTDKAYTTPTNETSFRNQLSCPVTVSPQIASYESWGVGNFKAEIGGHYQMQLFGPGVKKGGSVQWSTTIPPDLKAGSPETSSTITINPPGTEPITVKAPACRLLGGQAACDKEEQGVIFTFETPLGIAPASQYVRVKNTDSSTTNWCKLELVPESGKPVITLFEPSAEAVKTTSNTIPMDIYGNGFTSGMIIKYVSVTLMINNSTGCDLAGGCVTFSDAISGTLTPKFISHNHLQFTQSQMQQTSVGSLGPWGYYEVSVFDPLANYKSNTTGLIRGTVSAPTN